MAKPTQQMTWGQIGVLWMLAVPALLLAFALSPKKPAKKHRRVAAPAATKDPVSEAAFQAGYAFGAKWKASGLAKPTERELDEYALQLLAGSEVPDDKRGIFISKFKSGFGWGGW